MHEFSITQELVSLAAAECQKAGLVSATKIVVELGSLSSYTPDAINFYFDMLRGEEPRLSSATLEIEKVQAVLHCQQCGQEHAVKEPWMLACPNCSSSQVQVVRGKDFFLKRIVGELNDKTE